MLMLLLLLPSASTRPLLSPRPGVQPPTYIDCLPKDTYIEHLTKAAAYTGYKKAQAFVAVANSLGRKWYAVTLEARTKHRRDVPPP